MSVSSTVAQLWAKADRGAVRAFFLSIGALSVALLLAIYSGAAAEIGNMRLAASAALGALALAAWVGVTLVPTLARRTPLRWLGFKTEFRVTREGWIYMAGVILVALAALNTGNNLLFLILASLIAIILMSGILSSITLSGLALRVELPQHIFAGQPVRCTVELENEKLTMPSFALRVEAAKPKRRGSEASSGKASGNVAGSSVVGAAIGAAAVLESPVYFAYLPKKERLRQSVPVTFARRGMYRQDAFRIVTRFPFGFLQKARRLEMGTEVLVYPAATPSDEFMEILPGLQGAMESLSKGHGQDLYALRGYVPTDSASHVHWKASARFGSLMVREFTREDDCRILLVLDPHTAESAAAKEKASATNVNAHAAERFERAVTLCAGIAWHFYERNAQLQFRSAGMETSLAPAEENIFAVLRHLALVQPLPVDPEHKLLSDLAASPDLFKVIVTSQRRGTIPSELWQSSYVIFLDDLLP